MPIAEQIYRILYKDLEPKEALRNLMGRDLGISGKSTTKNKIVSQFYETRLRRSN
jgi:hypothetical protein